MSRRVRSSMVVLLLLLLGGTRLFAQATATIAVTGTEQQVAGAWDSSSITITLDGFSETYQYGQFSTPNSVASAFSAMFSRDFYQYGLSTGVAVGSTGRNVITFQLNSGSFSPATIIDSNTSFSMAPTGALLGGSSTGPTISSVSPSHGYAGQTTPIEIQGFNFGSGTPTVTFNGTPVTSFSYVSPTVIVAFLPANATEGPIVVTTGGVSSAGWLFSILQPPTITGISPSSGMPGTPITISGTQLSGCPGMSFGTGFYPIAPSATSVATLVQTGAAPAAGGTVSVALICEDFKTNPLSFTVQPAGTPAIASVTPSAVYSAQASGDTPQSLASITLKGTNFGSSGTVNYSGGWAISYLSSDGQTIVVPAYDAGTGPLTVTSSGLTSNGVQFTVAPTPTVTSISPRSGPVGTAVQVTGTNLGAMAGTTLAACGTLVLNSTPVAVSPGSSTTLSATVPSAAAAGSGPAVVVCNGYQVVGPQFTVGTAYDNGTVALTVNGVTDSVPYGESQNAASGSLVSALISAVNADPNAFVTAVASGSTGGITLTSKEPGAASTYAFSLVDNYDSYDFSGPSFTPSPPTGTLSGGTDPAVTQTPVYSYNINSYDANGNLLSYTDNVMGTWSFGYDPLNRLASATTSKSIESGNLDYCWSYDQFGNRLGQFGSNQPFAVGSTGSPACQAAPTPATLTTNIATYNSSNQMLTSNASGNLITPVYDMSGDTVNDGKNNYLYDAEGRVCAAQSLLSGTITGYLYDAGGNRVAKGTLSTLSCDLTLGSQTPTPLPNNGFALTAQYLLGPGGEQMTELNAAGTWVHVNVTANGTLFASFDNDGKGVHFFLDDWLGTRRVQTNYLGAVENTWTSLPYGDALTPSASNPDPTEQHFTGKERDTESGLDYFGARYYASSMARFMSPDWAAKAEPVPYAVLGDPQSLNLYSYVRDNPLRRNDPDGHCSQQAGGQQECGNVKVTVQPTSQPAPVQARTLTDKDKTKTGTSPGATLQMTVAINGTPTPGVEFKEKNAMTITMNGITTNSPPPVAGKFFTDNNGTFRDGVAAPGPDVSPLVTPAQAAALYNKTPITITDTQTLTLTLPDGCTCAATSTRTISNTPDGKTISPGGYTLTTTQPVVAPAPQPQP